MLSEISWTNKKGQYIYAIVKSEDTFIGSIIQVEIYVAWYKFKTQV